MGTHPPPAEVQQSPEKNRFGMGCAAITREK